MADISIGETSLLSNIGRYYGERYQEHGDSAQGMDWKDRASQYLRFEVISRYIDWTRQTSVLDVGCGNGELLAFFQERGRHPCYRGVDVCEDMVAACRRRFGPESAALASTADLEPDRWDYVVASGAFNVKQDTRDEVWRRHFHRSVRDMFAACRVAVIFNAMTWLVDFRYEHLYYAESGEMATLASACGTRSFLIDHSYPLFEMTVAFWRQPFASSPA